MEPFDEVVARIEAATALLITAGAGMSADSGVPTYRDDDGLWVRHDPSTTIGLTSRSMREHPESAWALYREMCMTFASSSPHQGYSALLEVARAMRDGWFVYTSNVDEYFVRAGFDPPRVVECHGSLAWMQCHWPCCDDLVPIETHAAVPACPSCGEPARPNILLFDDFSWVPARMNDQLDRLEQWLDTLPTDARLLVLEIGAGTAVPSVRALGEDVALRRGAAFVRINLNEPASRLGPSLALSAREALLQIGARLQR